MDEQDFRLLSLLNKTKNITHASDKMYITQSSVSKRIRQMEHELGTNLMLRSRQGIHFTPSGETVVKHAENILSELNTMRQELEMRQDEIAGTLNAGISVNYTRYCLTENLLDYNKKYPLVNTQIITTYSQALYNMLLNGEIDVGIMRGKFDGWRGEKILLFRENICLINSKENADKPLNELTRITWKMGRDLYRAISQWTQENNISPSKNQIMADSTATCLNMVNKGLGWSIVPEICLKNFQGTVRPLFFSNGEPLMRSSYMMYPKHSLELPQVRAFIELVKEHTLRKKSYRRLLNG